MIGLTCKLGPVSLFPFGTIPNWKGARPGCFPEGSGFAFRFEEWPFDAFVGHAFLLTLGCAPVHARLLLAWFPFGLAPSDLSAGRLSCVAEPFVGVWAKSLRSLLSRFS